MRKYKLNVTIHGNKIYFSGFEHTLVKRGDETEFLLDPLILYIVQNINNMEVNLLSKHLGISLDEVEQIIRILKTINFIISDEQ